MSPELLDPDRFGLGDGRPTKHSDCYALGMVILEVLSGKPPFSNYNNFVVIRKIIEGEHPGRPQGEEEVWFTDRLWEMLEQCWSPQPARRPTINAVLESLKQDLMAQQPLPSDSDDCTQSDSDDQSDFTLSHDPSVDPSIFLHLALNLTHPLTAFIAARIDRQDDDQTPAPSQDQSHGVYAGRDSHRPSPGRQQGLAEPPVSTTSDMVDTFVSYDNP